MSPLSLFNCESNSINRRILDCINHITQLLWEQFIQYCTFSYDNKTSDRCIAMYGACLTDSTCVHSSMWTGRNDPMCASGPLKHKKPLCIISWGGGMERQRGGVWSWGRGQWPYSQPTRWPHSQCIGILCLPPLFFITFTILPSLSTALLAFFLSANTINQLSRGWGSCSLTLSYAQHILSCQLSVAFYASLSYVTHGAKEPLCFTN